MNGNNIFQDKNVLILIIFLSVVSFIFIFLPAINLPYYAGDAYRYALGGIYQSCKADDGFEFMLTLGRPLQAYLDCFVYKFAYSFEHMKIVRLLAVTLSGIAMAMFALQLYRWNIAPAIAFFVAGCLFLIPHLYEDTVIAGALSLPVSIIFTELAYFFFNKTHLTQYSKSWLYFAAISLLTALFTYPALAFFFVTLILARFLFDSKPWQILRKEIFRESVFFLLVCVMYFIIAYLNMHFHSLAPVPDAYQLNHPNLDFFEIVNRFLSLGNVFSYHWQILRLTSIQIQGWIILIILAFGIGFFLINFFLKQTIDDALQYLFVFFFLCILSAGFFLVIPSSQQPIMLRFLFGALASALVILFWCLYQCVIFFPKKIKTGFVFFMVFTLFLIESYQAGIHTMASAIAYEHYFNSIAIKATDYLAKTNHLKRLHFVLAKNDYPYLKFFMAHQILKLTAPNTNYSLVWCSLPRGIVGREQDHQPEILDCIHRIKDTNRVAVTYSFENETFNATPDTLLIETQHLTIDSLRNEYLAKYFNTRIS